MPQKYVMDFIPDETLFKAVMYARRLMKRGTPPAIANTRAAKYYGVSVTEVTRHTGQTGGRVASKRKKKRSL